MPCENDHSAAHGRHGRGTRTIRAATVRERLAHGANRRANGPFLVGIALVLMLSAGCDMLAKIGQPFASSQPAGAPNGGTRNPPKLSPVLERMRKAYPDLASGRFVSLADLESPDQVALFRLVAPDGSAPDNLQPRLSILRSRNETGGGGLKVDLPSAAYELVMDGQRSDRLALLRDWRKYGLLLMSLYGPPGGAEVQFTVRSGETLPAEWARTLHVVPGWNLLRLDVDTLGDSVDLADIRALAWRAPQATGPKELYLDDLILADNTRWVLGEHAGADELHVFTRGLRIHVDVPARFELAFAEGVLVRWHDPGGGNLVDSAGLGPWPVPLAEDWAAQPAGIAYDDPQLFASWGPAVAAGQRLLEATPFRVVLEGRWRFVPPGPTSTRPAAELPGHTWQYVIYPSGRVHVRVTSRAPQAGWSAPRLGYAVGLDGHRDFRALAPPSTVPPGFALLARPGPDRGDLLWAWPQSLPLTRQRELVSEDERRLALLVGDLPVAEVVDTAHLLRIWPADIDAALDGAGFAADYRNPATITATAGELVTDTAGDLDHDGYNEAQGSYELALADDVLRFTCEPGPYPRFDPVLRVHGTAGRQCWVYARGRLINTVGRDADDNLLFGLGRLVSSPVAVEVHTRPAKQP
jgi:hypothetical protein